MRTYQRIRDELPPGSPGEWYGIYPPFAKGFSDHSEAWQYVNGGVSPIFAGELARGAFVHGFEAYGADVLSRVLALARSSGDQSGSRTPAPTRRLRSRASRRSTSRAREHGPRRARARPACRAGWPRCRTTTSATCRPGRQTFAGVPFLVTDPGRERAPGGDRRLAPARLRPERVEVPVGTKAGSIYVLHSVGNVGNEKLAGAISFVLRGRHRGDAVRRAGRQRLRLVVPVARGLVARGLRPAAPAAAREARLAREERRLPERRASTGTASTTRTRSRRIKARSSSPARSTARSTRWPASRSPTSRSTSGRPRVSFGGPDNWAAGAIVYALVEGLAGVVDATSRTARPASPRVGPPPGRTRRRSSSTTRPRTATWPTTTATTRRGARSRSR